MTKKTITNIIIYKILSISIKYIIMDIKTCKSEEIDRANKIRKEQ